MDYPVETLSDDDDGGTMPENVNKLAAAVVGHRIVAAVKPDSGPLVITLDDGTTVTMADTSDCCAYTELESFVLHADRIDHVIMGVGTTDGYETWHIYADFGDVMEMKVGWSCGNPFYYGYGFAIQIASR